MTYHEWHLVRRPEGAPVDEDFALVQTKRPAVDDDDVLVRNTFLSLDPYMRGRMNDTKSYVPPFGLGMPMVGGAVGVVEEVSGLVLDGSGSRVEVGATVLHDQGWRTHAVLPGPRLRVLDTTSVPAQAWLGVLGMTGLTAYAGLLRVARFQRGDAVFVSAAAGSVGSLVGQIARLKGASLVVGSAGGPDKAQWLLDDLGFDRAIDYKAVPVGRGLREAAPDGVDVYFDNVGGDHLEAAISSLRLRGRVAVCGMISRYNDTGAAPGPKNLALFIGKRLTMTGFLVNDHADLRQEFEDEVGGWVREGKVVWRETAVEGIEEAVHGFQSMLAGGNTGKMLVRI